MHNPKGLPLELLKALKEVYNDLKDKYDIVQDENQIIGFYDKDKSSNFCFKILSTSYSVRDSSVLIVKYEICPKSSISNNSEIQTLHYSKIGEKIKKWDSVVTQIYNLLLFFEDVSNPYEAEFYSYFTLTDEEKQKQYNSIEVVKINHILNEFNKILEEHKTEDNTDEIEDIKSDIKDLQNNLTNKTKDFITKSISKVYGKMAKVGASVIEDALKTLLTKGAGKAISWAMDNIDTVKELGQTIIS